MRKKGILAAFMTACLSACLGICTLNVSASVTYADLFETQGLTVTENVSGATLKNAAEVILYPNEDKTGMGLTTATGTAGTVALKEKLTGAFEVDFRVWSQTNGTADVESVVWKFDDGTNSFTVNFIPANEWNNTVPGVTVSINDDTTDKFCYYYTTTWNTTGYNLNSYRCAGVSTPIYGSSFTNADTIRFLPGTN